MGPDHRGTRQPTSHGTTSAMFPSAPAAELTNGCSRSTFLCVCHLSVLQSVKKAPSRSVSHPTHRGGGHQKTQAEVLESQEALLPGSPRPHLRDRWSHLA